MIQRHVTRTILILTAGVCVALFTAHTQAGNPHAQVRFFVEIAPWYTECQDWEAEGSQRLVTHFDSVGNSQGFGEPDYVTYFDPPLYLIHDDEGNLLLNLANTSWVRMPVKHVTDDGVESVNEMYWLDESAGTATDFVQNLAGVNVATGPEGDVVVLRTYRVNYGNDTRLYITSSGYFQARICMGLFQK